MAASKPWICSVCTFKNMDNSSKCAMCLVGKKSIDNDEQTATSQKIWSAPNAAVQKEWNCPLCTFENSGDVNICSLCSRGQKGNLSHAAHKAHSMKSKGINKNRKRARPKKLANPYISDTSGNAMQPFSQPRARATLHDQEAADLMAQIDIEWMDCLKTQSRMKLTSEKRKSDEVKLYLKFRRCKHGKQEKVEESRTTYAYWDPLKLADASALADAPGLAAVGALGSALVGGADMAAVGHLCATFLQPVAAAAGCNFASIAAAVIGIKNGYSYYMNLREENKLRDKQQHNVKAELFNTKLQQLKQVETQLLENRQKLIEHEKKLENAEFYVERSTNNGSRVIVLVGPTGFGKSVICNRFIGDDHSTDNMEGYNDETQFKVASLGDADSTTAKIQKVIKQVTLIDRRDNTQSRFILSVVDTPGAFDSSDNDNNYNNQMAKYFRASGGVNMFCIVFKFGGKLDANYKKLLKLYATFWGTEFWKHCAIIITHCDTGTHRKLDQKLLKLKQRMKTFLQQYLGVRHAIPMYEFGQGNFETGIKRIFQSLTEPGNVYYRKHKCDTIKSPLDTLWMETAQLLQEHTKLSDEAEKAFHDMKRSRTSQSVRPPRKKRKLNE